MANRSNRDWAKGKPRKGTFKWGEPKTEVISNINLTETAFNWLRNQPPGWLPDFLETEARKSEGE